MPTVEYLTDLQTHSKGDTAWLDENSAVEQEELGVLKIVAADDFPSEEVERLEAQLAAAKERAGVDDKPKSKTAKK